MGYWVASTHSKGKKYCCIFNEIGNAEKWLKNLLSPIHNTFRTTGMGDYYHQLEENFTIKYFDSKTEASNFQDEFFKNK